MNKYNGGRMIFDDQDDEQGTSVQSSQDNKNTNKNNNDKQNKVDPSFQDEGLDFKFFNKEEYQAKKSSENRKEADSSIGRKAENTSQAGTDSSSFNRTNSKGSGAFTSTGTGTGTGTGTDGNRAFATTNSADSSNRGTGTKTRTQDLNNDPLSSFANSGDSSTSSDASINDYSSGRYQDYQGRMEFSDEDFEEALKNNSKANERESNSKLGSNKDEKTNPEDMILYGRSKSFPWISTIATLLLAAFSYASVTGLVTGITNADVYQILINSATILIVVFLGKTLITEFLTLKLLKRREEKSLELEAIEGELYGKGRKSTSSQESSIKDEKGNTVGGRQVFDAEDYEKVEISKEPRDTKLYNYLLKLIKELKLPANNPGVLAFHKHVNAYTSSQQMLELFEREILKPLDEQAQKIVRKYALRDLVVVSATNSHIFDMAFVFFRNLQMLQEITSLYGMKITYFSRLSLIKHIFVNIALTGAAEYLQEMGANFFSTSFLAKISTTLAQGLSVGLLTTRLGVRAIRFSRPLPFNYNDEPQVKYFFSEMIKESKELMRYGSDNDKKLP